MRVMTMLAVVGLAAAGGCGPTPAVPPKPAEWSADVQAVADGQNQFAFDLYGRLWTTPGNLFVSPYSAHAALAMTAVGAKGATREQMARVLHLPADETQALAAGAVGRYYNRPRPDFTLATANAVWGQTDYPWRPAFLTTLTDQFGAGFQPADFIHKPDAERVRVNAWAEQQTRGKIKDLIAPGLVTTDTRMVLANAVYFKAAWATAFDPKQTRPAPFTLADKTVVQVPTMSRLDGGGFRHYVQPEFEVAELPYKEGGELAMVILLPGTPDGLPALEAKLTPAALSGWLAAATPARSGAGLSLPKFAITTAEMRFDKPLQALGMTDAFNGRADFTGMHSGGEQLRINFVVQKAFVDVTEEGTEAAAATAVGMIAVSEPRGFHADRPFVFLIRDTKRGTILFMGRVERP